MCERHTGSQVLCIKYHALILIHDTHTHAEDTHIVTYHYLIYAARSVFSRWNHQQEEHEKRGVCNIRVVLDLRQDRKKKH